MRILMCSPHPLVRELGAPKVLIELAEAMQRVGAECRAIGPADYGGPVGADRSTRIARAERLREFLATEAGRYDVLDYDHEELPFPRDEFEPRVLMVARSVLLVHHLESIDIPRPLTLRARLGAMTRGRGRRALRSMRIERATRTLHEADLVNLCNGHDREELVRRGIDGSKLIILPHGLHASRRTEFEHACPATPPLGSRIAFVGTFDYRKGGADMPRIFDRISRCVPETRLRLLGTAGMFQTVNEVSRLFPRRLRPRIEIIPRFAAGALPGLLSDCSVGVFPSYCEGFGFGVLEMLAAAIPVIAYDAPGPPMMLPEQWLASPGDVRTVAGKVINLLNDVEQLAAARQQAREMSRPFDWECIARETLREYSRAAAERRR
jgi:glycosyltransferase involved in cell wall biosynthesis